MNQHIDYVNEKIDQMRAKLKSIERDEQEAARLFLSSANPELAFDAAFAKMFFARKSRARIEEDINTAYELLDTMIRLEG